MKITGFKCRPHGNKLPCPNCLLINYNRCVDENRSKLKPVHDLTQMKKQLEELGIEYE